MLHTHNSLFSGIKLVALFGLCTLPATSTAHPDDEPSCILFEWSLDEFFKDCDVQVSVDLPIEIDADKKVGVSLVYDNGDIAVQTYASAAISKNEEIKISYSNKKNRPYKAELKGSYNTKIKKQKITINPSLGVEFDAHGNYAIEESIHFSHKRFDAQIKTTFDSAKEKPYESGHIHAKTYMDDIAYIPLNSELVRAGINVIHEPQNGFSYAPIAGYTGPIVPQDLAAELASHEFNPEEFRPAINQMIYSSIELGYAFGKTQCKKIDLSQKILNRAKQERKKEMLGTKDHKGIHRILTIIAKEENNTKSKLTLCKKMRRERLKKAVTALHHLAYITPAQKNTIKELKRKLKESDNYNPE